MPKTHIETLGNCVNGYIDDRVVIRLSRTVDGIVVDVNSVIPYDSTEAYISLYTQCLERINSKGTDAGSSDSSLIQEAVNAGESVIQATIAAREYYSTYVELTKQLKEKLGDSWQLKEKSFDTFIQMAKRSDS